MSKLRALICAEIARLARHDGMPEHGPGTLTTLIIETLEEHWGEIPEHVIVVMMGVAAALTRDEFHMIQADIEAMKAVEKMKAG